MNRHLPEPAQKVAIITGASQGFGAGLAAAFRRAGYADDVVDGILYLERATFVTGEILHIDGGQAAGH
jgi:NAD(P)-dependent dehydrogenase (short-subunit alcohol dehydrogenase family)